ncbi:hypothetical protein PV-S19_0135 [Pacmanvirus S19]|nr:hypothetical protein PV-S19_0135 [Pacmanvirus S19]
MENNQFTINGFFNNLPIRIIGTTEEPFFYANDIGAVLGIKNIATSITGFDETEIVTPEVRQKYNLITYYKYKDEMRRDDRIVLFTEFGVYRLILCSRSVIAKDFKKYVYQLIKNARNTEKQKLNVISQNDFNEMKQKMEVFEKSHMDYLKHNPAIYVFYKEINDNPYNYIPPKDIDKEFAQDYTDKCEKIFKFTTSPKADDYTLWVLHSKIYGDSEQIMDELLEGALEIMPDALKHTRYHDNFDFEVTLGRVIIE